MLHEEFTTDVANAVQSLKGFLLYENSTNKHTINMLRSIYMPEQYSKFMHSNNDGDLSYSYTQYDPIPENSFERACSGMMTYHISPLTQFFKLSQPVYSSLTGEEPSERLTKGLGNRTRAIHSIIQEVQNFQVVAQVNRDKLCFGLGCHVIEEDEQRVSKFSHIPTEDIALGTSNGTYLDVYGIRKELNMFQARQLFKNPLNPMYWEDKRIAGLADQQKKYFYRFNIPLPILRRHLIDKIQNDYQDKFVERMVDNLLPSISSSKIVAGNVPWVDIWFTDDEVMSIDVKDYRPIIVSMMSPPYKINSLSRGQGEKALPLALLLTEMEVINLTAFERTFAPAWSVGDEAERLGLTFDRDGVNFIEKGTQEPKPMSLGASMADAREYKQYTQARYDRMFFVDVFELMQKDRMTEDEVQIRNQDSLVKMIFYTIQDQYDFLNPTVLTINNHIHKRLKRRDELSKQVLTAQYTSALAFANKTSLMTKLNQFLQTGRGVADMLTVDSEVNDELGYTEYFKHIIAETGEDLLLRSPDDAAKRRAERIRGKQLAYQKAQADALAGASNAVATASQAQSGGRPQQQQGQKGQGDLSMVSK